MNKLDLVISFDDTGSMASVRKQVRMKIAKLVNDIFMENLDLRVGVIIHNDYCDHDTIQLMDLTCDHDKITKFVNNSSSCGGGDSDECYELVLNNFHSKFSWRDGKRIAVLIGDANPHPVGYQYKGFTNTLDWKKEADICAENGISVYSVHALGNSKSRPFYEGVANRTNGAKITLDQFAHINEFISAIVHGENDQLSDYENSNPLFKTNTSFRNMFNSLKRKFGGMGYEEESSYVGTGVSLLSKFQVMEVGYSCPIREFVDMTGARFQVGKGYYELTKSETVQARKAVIMQHKVTGEVIGDTAKCREMIGLPYGTAGTVSPRSLPAAAREYDIFIQSTSYNRKLMGGTRFLYEMDESDL